MPQRRNRIYLVVDFTARRAGKVLFEQTSLRRDSPACGTTRQGAAADVEGSAAGSTGELNAPCVCNESGQGYWMPGFACLRAEGENRLSRPGHLVYYDQPQQIAYALQGNTIDCATTANCNGCGWKANVSYTINTVDRHAVCYQDPAGMGKMMQLLSASGIRFIDNTDRGGCFWIELTPESEALLNGKTIDGKKIYMANRSKAFKNVPALFVK